MSTKSQLQTEMEDTRHRFHQLLASIPDETLNQPSQNPAWTVGEVLYHMSLAPRFMVADAKLFLEQPALLKWLPRLFPETLFHWLNARLTRYGARHLNRQFLAAAYDKAHEANLETFLSLSEADLSKTVQYPGWDPLLAGEITLAYLFGYIKRHFDSHAAQLKLNFEENI